MTKYVSLVIISWVSFTFAMELGKEEVVRCKSPFTPTLIEPQQKFLIYYVGAINKSQSSVVCPLLRRFVFQNPALLDQQRVLILKAYLFPRLSAHLACKRLQRSTLRRLALGLPEEEQRFVLKRMPSIVFEWQGT